MSERYAILDTAGIGANLSVEQSGEILAIGYLPAVTARVGDGEHVAP